MQKKGKVFLVLRFSAMGDVAMVVPVIQEVSKQNPSARFVVLTRKKFFPFFENINNCLLVEADLDGKHKQIFHLLRLVYALKKTAGYHEIIDLHQNIRTFAIKKMALLFGINSFTINKGRKEKRKLIQKNNKELRPLESTFERYLSVFQKAGLLTFIEKNKENYFAGSEVSPLEKNEDTWIGIAPFAQHETKVWPFSNYPELIKKTLSISPNIKILLFGGGKKETELLIELAGQKNVINLASVYTLSQELAIISQLDVMVCMDSSNMHLAAISNVPVISVWGPTHPYAGFKALNQNPELIVQNTELECRPCSIYGNKPCHREDHACMSSISIDTILAKIKQVISSS